MMTKHGAVLAGALLLGGGCVSNLGRGVSSATVTPTALALVRTDIVGLSREVKLPRRPIGVRWQIKQIGNGTLGPSDFQLDAVLDFAPQDANAIEAMARKRGGIRKESVEVLPWFPPRLQSRGTRNPKGRLVFSADKLNAADFAHLSLQNGFAVRVPHTSTFVLSLFTT